MSGVFGQSGSGGGGQVADSTGMKPATSESVRPYIAPAQTASGVTNLSGSQKAELLKKAWYGLNSEDESGPSLQDLAGMSHAQSGNGNQSMLRGPVRQAALSYIAQLLF